LNTFPSYLRLKAEATHLGWGVASGPSKWLRAGPSSVEGRLQPGRLRRRWISG
jgi:hypothetical protein